MGGFVCNDGVGRNEVNAICRSLGFNTGIQINVEELDIKKEKLGDTPFVVTDVSCPADAKDPMDCSVTEYSSAKVPCANGQQLAVSCSKQAFEFFMAEVEIDINKRGKLKFMAYPVALKYGREMSLKNEMMVMVLNRSSEGEYEPLGYGKPKRTGVWKGKSQLKMTEFEKGEVCVVVVAMIPEAMKYAVEIKYCDYEFSAMQAGEELEALMRDPEAKAF